MELKIILTGATGFVGEGVLLSTLEHPDVKEVLIVNRRQAGITHPKLKELIVPDFTRITEYAAYLKGYDACFYCAGISSVGLKEAAYTHITYELTMAFAKVLLQENPQIIFNFVSGSHTDSSEQGKIMWARVKGKTENALMQMPFRQEYNFRPGGMLSAEGQKNVKTGYKVLVSILSWIIPRQIVTLKVVADAMINAVKKGYPQQVLEIRDIKALANS